MRSIQVLRKPVTGWQVLPVDAPDFESAALRACELVLAGDARIGKIPGARASKFSKAAGRSPKPIKTSKKHGSTINFDTVRKIGLALMMSLYATLGIFLLLASRNPSAYRSLIAFGGWANLAHAGVMAAQEYRNVIERRELAGVVVFAVVGVLLVVLARAWQPVERASTLAA